MQSPEERIAAPPSAGPIYRLRLYVAGQTPKSVLAFTNLKQICEEHLLGRYEIEIIDLRQDPQLAHGDQILAVPTLARRLRNRSRNHRRSIEYGTGPRRARPAPAQMTTPTTERNVRALFEQAARRDERYALRLYVTGMTARSTRAIENLRAICDEYLDGRYDLEVVDICQQPVLTKGEQIIAAPTLIKKLPLPMRRIIGDMSNRERVLLGLDLVRLPGGQAE
jgi:circadian clock protein KaiB